MTTTAVASKGWQAAMDAQLDIATLLRSALGRGMVEGFAADVESKKRAGYKMIRALPEFGPPSLLASEPVWVESNIVDLVQAAAERWRPEPLLPIDLLCPNGFVLFEKPLRLSDVYEHEVAYRAFAWQFSSDERTGELGIIITLWSHIDDRDYYTDIQSPEEVEALRRGWGHHKFLLTHLTPVWFGHMPEVDEDGYLLEMDSEYGRLKPEGTMPAGVMAFFRLAQQRILERQRMRPDRAYRRRAKRYGQDEPYVTVIQLRRSRQEGEGEGEVEWSKRWIVGGHWRRQRYGKKDEEPYYRNIWIAPYVKGPDDKPLEIRDLRAWEFKR